MKTVVLAAVLALLGARPEGRVKVYVLAGQSNMEGKAKISLLETQLASEETRARFAHLKKDGRWIEREDVRIKFLDRRGPLTEWYVNRPGGLEQGFELEAPPHARAGPLVVAMAVQGDLDASVTGNEVSTPIGHMNAFPLDHARAPVDSSLADANELFRLIRAETNASGVVPVIQLNHPRWSGIDWFT